MKVTKNTIVCSLERTFKQRGKKISRTAGCGGVNKTQ